MKLLHGRAFAVVLAVVTLLGVGACGGKAGDDKVSTQGATSTTTSVSGGGDGTVEAGQSDSGPGRAGGGGSAGAQSGGSQSGGTSEATPAPPPTASGAAQPARAGTYTYDVEGTVTQTGPLGRTGPLATPQTLTVDAADGGRQRSVLDARDPDGEGTITTTVLLYRDDGVYLESLKTENMVSGVTITYEFIPDSPQLIAPTGVDVGFHTEFSITSTNGGIRTTTTIDALSRETVTVDGAEVDTMKVRTHTVLEGDADGEATSTMNVDPLTSLSLVDHTVADVDTAFGGFKTNGTSTLRSLTPG